MPVYGEIQILVSNLSLPFSGNHVNERFCRILTKKGLLCGL